MARICPTAPLSVVGNCCNMVEIGRVDLERLDTGVDAGLSSTLVPCWRGGPRAPRPRRPRAGARPGRTLRRALLHGPRHLGCHRLEREHEAEGRARAR